MNNLSLLFSSSTTEPEPLKLLDGISLSIKDSQVINSNVALGSLKVLTIGTN